MATAYVFTLQPTFTQGLLLGQLSVLLVLVGILRYLFLSSEPVAHAISFPTRTEKPSHPPTKTDNLTNPKGQMESLEWFNEILQQVCPFSACRVASRLKLSY